MFKFERDALARGVASPFVHTRTVAFQEVDAAGIVFFARVFDYFHDAYVAWLASVGHPLPRALTERRWAAPLRHAGADYLRPLRFGDAVRIELGPVRVRGSDVTIGYRLCCDDQVRAVGQTVHTFVDAETFQRSDIPADLRRRFHELGGEPESGAEA